MQSHRRPRGKIAFESFCALCVGASFVGAWMQTGAWAFIGPAFIFALFGFYWSFDLFGRHAVAVQPSAAPAAQPEIRFERFEPPIIEAEPAAAVEFSPEESVVPFAPVEAAPVRAKPRKARAKKAAPVAAPEPVSYVEDAHPEPHIEQLFDPQPLARQARPAFGKRSRGMGPGPLPAA